MRGLRHLSMAVAAAAAASLTPGAQIDAVARGDASVQPVKAKYRRGRTTTLFKGGLNGDRAVARRRRQRETGHSNQAHGFTVREFALPQDESR